MIKAIVFDFDGVLVESAEIKTEAFRELFSKWPDNVDDIAAYHLGHMGITRYVKFKYIYESILHLPYSDEVGRALGEQFARLVVEKVKQAPFVNGAVDFLENHYKTHLLFVVSGTPQDELRDIVTGRKLGRYFRGVFGSPAAKPEIIRKILSDYGLQHQEVIFVGDASSDRVASKETDINFILRVTPENEDKTDGAGYELNDLSQLEDVLKEMES